MRGKRQTVLQGRHVKKKWKKKKRRRIKDYLCGKPKSMTHIIFLTWKSSAGAAANLDGLHLSVLAIDAHDHHLGRRLLNSAAPTLSAVSPRVHGNIWFGTAFRFNWVNMKSPNYKHGAIVNPPSLNALCLAEVTSISPLRGYGIFTEQISSPFPVQLITLIPFVNAQMCLYKFEYSKVCSVVAEQTWKLCPAIFDRKYTENENDWFFPAP